MIESSHKRLIFAVCVAQFFMPFMMSGVNAVLPPLGEELGASARELSLVGTFYSLGLVVFQLPAGSLGDIWGRRRVFMCGVAIFAVSCGALGSVSSMPLFLGLRFLQGVGGALFNASGLALLASASTPDKRAIYLGFSTTTVYAGVACGPPVAGFIAEVFGWRWLFWGNAAAMAAALLLMKLSVKLEWRTAKGQPFDFRGCTLYALAMTALTFGASTLAFHPESASFLILLFVFLLFAFVLCELKTFHPLLDVRFLVQHRVFALSSLAAFINYSSIFGMIFFFSLFLQTGHGLDTRQAGLFLAVQPLAQLLTTPLAARLCLIWDAGKLSAVGVALCGLGLLAAAFLDLSSPIWNLAVAQCLLGCGTSFFSMPNTTIILESAGKEHLGQASGLTGAVRNAGQLFNMVVVTITLSLLLGHESVSGQNFGVFLNCMKIDLIIFGVLNLLAVGCALVRNKTSDRRA
ncbi:MAG: MFS transporter [Desulfovibrio sp.]|jgi:MFS family permease|nr:MFS transporter [Desulfovibrio sp.]